jgi:hypothetical protein
MIIRRKHNARYTVVPNEPVVDERLSFECLGLLTYLLSRPDNWTINLAQLRGRGGVGREKMQQLMRQLIELGYAVRRRDRDAGNQQFGSWYYVIYDHPQGAEPETEIPSVESEKGATDGKAGDGKPVPILNTDLTKSPYGEADASRKLGVEISTPSPTTSSLIWKEARSLLSQRTSKNQAEIGDIIGKWFKRAPSEAARQELLQIVRGAAKSDTAKPIDYVMGGLREKLPPLPDPKSFTATEWQRNVQAAIKTKQWPPNWGPPPGKKGCRVPPELVTPQLQSALSQGTRA